MLLLPPTSLILLPVSPILPPDPLIPPSREFLTVQLATPLTLLMMASHSLPIISSRRATTNPTSLTNPPWTTSPMAGSSTRLPSSAAVTRIFLHLMMVESLRRNSAWVLQRLLS